MVVERPDAMKLGGEAAAVAGGPTAGAIAVLNIGGIAASTMPPNQLLKP
jgi:hypothetical protein